MGSVWRAQGEGHGGTRELPLLKKSAQPPSVFTGFAVFSGFRVRWCRKPVEPFGKDLEPFAQLDESFATVYGSPSNSHGKIGFNIFSRGLGGPDRGESLCVCEREVRVYLNELTVVE